MAQQIPSQDLTLNNLQSACFDANVEAGWHDTDSQHNRKILNAARLMLIVSEIGEAMEADRANLMDDKLPKRLGIEVELADAVIRIFDLAGANDLDLSGAIREKMAFNKTRADHTKVSRLETHGKKY